MLYFSHDLEFSSDIPDNPTIGNADEGDTRRLPRLYSSLTAGSTVILSDRHFPNVLFTLEHALAIHIMFNRDVPVYHE